MTDSFITWSPGTTIQSVVRQTIEKALQFYKGNKSAAARSLGITVPTLDKKLASYKLDDQSEKEFNDREKRKREFILARSRGQITDNAAWPDDSRPSRVTANQRLHMESTKAAAKEQTLPVQKRGKLQKVLPAETAPGGATKAGQPVSETNAPA